MSTARIGEAFQRPQRFIYAPAAPAAPPCISEARSAALVLAKGTRHKVAALPARRGSPKDHAYKPALQGIPVVMESSKTARSSHMRRF
ncbi:hypothetical protein ANO11243_040300 [Dothideomycetidae sp. 11243]|nr:hypothetical protein ANO11243_040300 [fungal sp. No.11243]